MSALVCLDWFWCLTILGAFEAYALGIVMRRYEEQAYVKQQEARVHKSVSCWGR